jgi:hypothetical protein
MVTADDVAEAGANHAVIQGWIDKWTPVAVEATEALRGVYDLPPLAVGTFDDALALATTTQAGLVEELGLSSKAMVTP